MIQIEEFNKKKLESSKFKEIYNTINESEDLNLLYRDLRNKLNNISSSDLTKLINNSEFEFLKKRVEKAKSYGYIKETERQKLKKAFIYETILIKEFETNNTYYSEKFKFKNNKGCLKDILRVNYCGFTEIYNLLTEEIYGEITIKGNPIKTSLKSGLNLYLLHNKDPLFKKKYNAAVTSLSFRNKGRINTTRLSKNKNFIRKRDKGIEKGVRNKEYLEFCSKRGKEYWEDLEYRINILSVRGILEKRKLVYESITPEIIKKYGTKNCLNKQKIILEKYKENLILNLEEGLDFNLICSKKKPEDNEFLFKRVEKYFFNSFEKKPEFKKLEKLYENNDLLIKYKPQLIQAVNTLFNEFYRFDFHIKKWVNENKRFAVRFMNHYERMIKSIEIKERLKDIIPEEKWEELTDESQDKVIIEFLKNINNLSLITPDRNKTRFNENIKNKILNYMIYDNLSVDDSWNKLYEEFADSDFENEFWVENFKEGYEFIVKILNNKIYLPINSSEYKDSIFNEDLEEFIRNNTTKEELNNFGVYLSRDIMRHYFNLIKEEKIKNLKNGFNLNILREYNQDEEIQFTNLVNEDFFKNIREKINYSHFNEIIKDEMLFKKYKNLIIKSINKNFEKLNSFSFFDNRKRKGNDDPKYKNWIRKYKPYTSILDYPFREIVIKSDIYYRFNEILKSEYWNNLKNKSISSLISYFLKQDDNIKYILPPKSRNKYRKINNEFIKKIMNEKNLNFEEAKYYLIDYFSVPKKDNFWIKNYYKSYDFLTDSIIKKDRLIIENYHELFNKDNFTIEDFIKPLIPQYSKIEKLKKKKERLIQNKKKYDNLNKLEIQRRINNINRKINKLKKEKVEHTEIKNYFGDKIKNLKLEKQKLVKEKEKILKKDTYNTKINKLNNLINPIEVFLGFKYMDFVINNLDEKLDLSFFYSKKDYDNDFNIINSKLNSMFFESIDNASFDSVYDLYKDKKLFNKFKPILVKSIEDLFMFLRKEYSKRNEYRKYFRAFLFGTNRLKKAELKADLLFP